MRIAHAISLVFTLAVATQANPIQDAQAAFDAGDYARAVELIDEGRSLPYPEDQLNRFEGVAQNALGAQMADQERWGESLRALGEAHRLIPDDEVITANLNRIRIQAAVHMAEQYNRFREALVLINIISEEVAPEIDRMRRDARVHIALLRAQESERQGQDESQRQALEMALEWDAESIPTLVDLGEWHYAHGDFDEALATLRRAYQIDPTQGRIRGLINTIRRDQDVTENHTHLRSDHFDVLYPPESREFTDVCLYVLEQTFERLCAEFEHTPPNRIPVVIYRQDQFQGVFEAPEWARAAFDGKLRIVARSIEAYDARRALQDTLSHELTHAFVNSIAHGHTPVWLDEGLAQRFEHNHRNLSDVEEVMLRQMKETDDLVPIPDLPADFASIGETARAQEAYLESLAFTEYLMRRFGGPKIRDILAQLDRGYSIEEAFVNELGDSLESLDQQWRQSL